MKLLKLTLIVFIISALSNVSFAWASDPVVHLNGDLLTLDVKDQPLSTILEKLTDQGIRIFIDPRINPRISAKFNNRPVESAMSSILRSVDYALVWKKNDTSGSGEPRLCEVRIFYKGEGERIRLLKKRTGMIVVTGDDGVHYVKDILLLQLDPTMTETALAEVLDQLNATIVGMQARLGIIQLRLPRDSDVQAIAKRVTGSPGIVSAEPDYASPLVDDRQVFMDETTALPASPVLPAMGSTRVAVMDSGLLADYEKKLYVQSVYDAVSPGAIIDDLQGHGTQMALIAAGVVNPLGIETDVVGTSPIVAIRIIADNGFTSNYTLMRGIDYAIQEEARVLSLSWGSETASPMLETVIDYATGKGLILVAAAGNVPTGKPVYPAAYDNVIGVGALTPNGEHWSQSNYGDFVAFYAPGLANFPVGYEGGPGTYVGTSIAAAYTAHQVAAVLDKMPDADVETVLFNLATKH